MTPEDFGMIAMIVNEFGNLGGEIYIGNITGEIRIIYFGGRGAPQLIEPHDLNNLLIVKQNEYKEELEPLEIARMKIDIAEPQGWRERNLRSYIGYLIDISYKLNELATFQKERKEKAKEKLADVQERIAKLEGE